MSGGWEDEWQGLLDEGLGQADGGDYETAELGLRAALRLATEAEDDERRAMTLNNLAGLLYEQGRVGEAEPLLREALALTERLRGENDPYVAQAHANVAMIAEAQHRYEEAEQHYLRAIALVESPLARDTADIATTAAETLYNLADLYRTLDRTAEARPLLERAVALLVKVWGPYHMDVAAMRSELAQTLIELEDFDAGIEAMRALADVRQRLLGEEHPDVAHVLNDLGVLYFRQGNATEAEALYLQALRIREAEYGGEHPSVATCENNLGGLFLREGRPAEAAPRFERALAIWEPTVGLGDPEVAMLLTNLGRAYRQLERTPEAIGAYERSLEAWAGILGDDHPGLRTPAAELVELLESAGHADEARAATERYGL